MLKIMGDPKTPARYRATTWIFYCIVLLLIAVAVVAPLYSIFGHWMADGENRNIWVQRSGAVTTLFSFIAGAVTALMTGRLHTPGFFGDINRLTVLIEFRNKFRIAETAIFTLSIVGTVIWGYGDLVYRWALNL